MSAGRDDLDPWLAASRADLSTRTPPAWLAARLQAHCEERRALQALRRRDAVSGSRPQSRSRAWWIGAPAVLVAGVLIAIALPAAIAPLVPTPVAAPFVALAPLEEIAAARGTLLVAGQVPREQLAEYGLPANPSRIGEPAQAEFLLSARGVVLAVRFIP